MAISFNANSSPALTAQQATAKISQQLVDGSATGASLKKLLDGFSPDTRLSIARDVVTALDSATGTDASELRGLAKRLEEFGSFVRDGQQSNYFPHSHHAQWMNAGNDLERQANALEGRAPEAGVRTT